MDLDEVRALTSYYTAQSAGAYDYYHGNLNQTGYGVGSFFGGAFRRLIPLIKNSSKYIGKQLLSSATNVLNDVQQDPSNLKSSLKRNAYQALNNVGNDLISKMRGGEFDLLLKKGVKKGRKRGRKRMKRSSSKIMKVIKRRTKSRGRPVKRKRSKSTNKRRRKKNNNFSTNSLKNLDYFD